MKKGSDKTKKTLDAGQLKTGVEIVELSDEGSLMDIFAAAQNSEDMEDIEEDVLEEIFQDSSILDKPLSKAELRRRKREARKARRRKGEQPDGDAAGEEAPEEALEEETQEEEEPPRPLTPREQEAERRRARVSHVLGIGVFLALFACALALTYFLLIIQHVEVAGNEDISPQYVLQTAGIETGTHIWLAKYKEARAALLQDPYIASVFFDLKYPDTVIVRIEERHAAAALMSLNTMAVIDETGFVLSIGNTDTAGLIKIYGAGSAGYRVNEHLGDSSDFTSKTLVDIIAAIRRQELGGVIESVDISNALSVQMATFSGYTVQLGQPEELDDKLAKLAIVLPYLESMGYSGGIVNVSVRGDPVYTPEGAAQPTIPPEGTPTDMPDPGGSPGPDGTPQPMA